MYPDYLRYTHLRKMPVPPCTEIYVANRSLLRFKRLYSHTLQHFPPNFRHTKPENHFRGQI